MVLFYNCKKIVIVKLQSFFFTIVIVKNNAKGFAFAKTNVILYSNCYKMVMH